MIDHHQAPTMDMSKLSDLKESLIKYYEEKDNLGFVDDASYSNITESSMLDPAAIEADGGFQASAYFDTNPNCLSARVTEEKNEWLRIQQELTPALQNSDWRKALEGLVEVELKETTLPREIWEEKSFGTKVSLFNVWIAVAEKL